MRRPEPSLVPSQVPKPGCRKRRPGACVQVRMRRARQRRRRAGRDADGPWVLLAIAAAALGDTLARSVLGIATTAAARPQTSSSTASATGLSIGRKSGSPGRDEAARTLAADTGLARFERARIDYLPPLSLGDAALARALDYLIRNNGGRHGPATEARWRTVDAASLPLAIYLRHTDDRSAWRSLQRELQTCTVTGARPVMREDRDLGREKLVKLVELSRVWAARGTLLLLDGPDSGDPAPAPELVPDGDLEPTGGPGRR